MPRARAFATLTGAAPRIWRPRSCCGGWSFAARCNFARNQPATSAADAQSAAVARCSARLAAICRRAAALQVMRGLLSVLGVAAWQSFPRENGGHHSRCPTGRPDAVCYDFGRELTCDAGGGVQRSTPALAAPDHVDARCRHPAGTGCTAPGAGFWRAFCRRRPTKTGRPRMPHQPPQMGRLRSCVGRDVPARDQRAHECCCCSGHLVVVVRFATVSPAWRGVGASALGVVDLAGMEKCCAQRARPQQQMARAFLARRARANPLARLI